MLRASVDWGRCRSCEPCDARLACKRRAVVKADPDEPAWVAHDRCSGCGDCLAACSHAAIDRLTSSGKPFLQVQNAQL